MKIGPKTGTIVDFPYAVARNLVLLHQAEDVGDQMRLPKAEASRVDAATVENAAPMGESNVASVSPRHVEVAASKIGSKTKKR